MAAANTLIYWPSFLPCTRTPTHTCIANESWVAAAAANKCKAIANKNFLIKLLSRASSACQRGVSHFTFYCIAINYLALAYAVHSKIIRTRLNATQRRWRSVEKCIIFRTWNMQCSHLIAGARTRMPFGANGSGRFIAPKRVQGIRRRVGCIGKTTHWLMQLMSVLIQFRFLIYAFGWPTVSAAWPT